MKEKHQNMFYNIKINYLCTVFFMVLDLRLTMKIGCRDDNLFFFIEVPKSICKLLISEKLTNLTLFTLFYLLSFPKSF